MNTARNLKIPILSLIKDGSELKSIPINGDIVFGRSDQCQVKLEGQSVSRKHALVRVDNQGVSIEKQSEFAPMSVNGLECTRALLKEGDVVQIGPYLLRLQSQKNLDNYAENRTKIIQAVRKEIKSTQTLESNLVLEATAPEKENEDIANNILGNSPGNSSEAIELANSTPEEPALQESSNIFNSNSSDLEIKLENPSEGRENITNEGSSELSGNPSGDFGEIKLENAESESSNEVNRSSEIQIPENNSENNFNQQLNSDLNLEKTDDIQVGENDPTRISDFANGKIVLISGEAEFSDYDIQKNEIIIGRGNEADLILNDKKCSRKHAIIESRAGRFFFKDLGSANGSFINDERVDQAELYNEDIIRIGRVEMRFFAKQKNYDQQQGGFLEVQSEDQNQEQGAVPSLLGTPSGEFSGDTQNAGLEGISGLGASSEGGSKNSQGNSLLAKFRALPPRKQLIYGIVGLLALYMLLDEEPETVVNKPNQKMGAEVKVHPSVRPSSSASLQAEKSPFDKLTIEQQQYIENQHQLSFRHFTNKEYDKAIYEIRKIFELIPEYKNAREIERYALDGQRILKAAEDERRKKEEELEFRKKLAEMIAFTSDLMKQKDYEAAKEKFGEILALEPDNEQVDEWKKEIDEFEERIRLEDQDKQVQKELNLRAWAAYQEALGIKKKGNCHLAIVEFGKVSDIGATDRKPSKMAAQMAKNCRAEINNRRDPLLAEAKQLEESGDLAKAFQVYKKVTVVDPPHRSAYAGMDRIRGILHQRAKIIYTEAVLAESYSDFSVAKKKYEEVLSVAPDDDLYYQRAKRKLGRFLSTTTGAE